jgi:hypothetical protein
MKLTLCTLAICLSVLTSVWVTKDLIRAEGKKIRSAVPKALSEPLDPTGRQESVIQKLDAISAQLVSLNRRMALVEDASGRTSRALPPETAPDPLLRNDVKALASDVRGISGSLARLEGVPRHLNELTTFLDQSFEHLEQTVAQTPAQEDLSTSLGWMVQKIDDIDSYFTPLYAFLGLVYDPANQDQVAAYPSIDARLNELRADIEDVRKAVADVRQNIIVPIVIEPTKHQN